MVTMKYPSDNEDGGAGEPSAPVAPIGETPDAPSDSAAKRVSERVLASSSSVTSIEARIRELEDIGMRARFSAEGLREHNAEIAGLKAMLTGAAGVDARVREIEQLMVVALMTPDASAALQLELDVLRLLQAALAGGFPVDG